MIYNKEAYELGSKRSAIRELFEYGKQRVAIVGAENVYDFSLGNPSVEPPQEIKDAIIDIVENEKAMMVHGYMSNSGYEDVREQIAKSLNEKHGTAFGMEHILMTVGAAGGLNVILKTLLNPEDEVIVFAPFFGEYRNYVKNYEGKLVVVPANTETFQPD